MKRRVRLGAIVVASLLAVALAPACGGITAQCSSYCERWRECIEGTVDVDSCEDACGEWVDGNSDRESKLDKCDECLTQNDACSDVTRRCTTDCFGIPVR